MARGAMRSADRESFPGMAATLPVYIRASQAPLIMTASKPPARFDGTVMGDRVHACVRRWSLKPPAALW